jgi:TPR repeat protein
LISTIPLRKLSYSLFCVVFLIGSVFLSPARGGDDPSLSSTIISKKSFSEWLGLAKKDDAMAQYVVGHLYEKGDGVKKNDAEAAKWYRKADKKGLSDATALLGVLYLEGRGVKQSNKKGIAFLKKAAKRGNIRARFNLGKAYNVGKHVKKNIVVSYMWFYLAAYVPRTPESFAAKKEMENLKMVMTKGEIDAALKKAQKYTGGR